jgi:hypothetical protein
LADPGLVEKAKAAQQKAGTGKYSAVPVKPFKPASSSAGGSANSANSASSNGDPTKPIHWVEVVLVDQDDHPLAGQAYQIELPDGTTATGTLDEKGKVRLDGITVGGSCKVCFPALDKDAWKPA